MQFKLKLIKNNGGKKVYKEEGTDNEITIRSDCKFHHIAYGFELSEKDRKEFDYLDFESEDGDGLNRDFVKHRGEWIDLGDVLRAPEHLQDIGWDGFNSDSFFSGVLIKYSKEMDSVKIGLLTC
jgi:hypothetical protein